MDRRRTLLVDAFAADPLAGNAAGVVPDASGLSESQMRAVARELSVSETAFLFPADGDDADADRRVRYFTPAQEVDLCGHATIASHAHLFADGAIGAGTHSLATNVGVLEIRVEEEGTVWMTQGDPEVRRVDADYDRLADALGVPVDALRDASNLPVARATTGLPFLLVPVAFLEPLGHAAPDMAAVEALADDYDAAGVYAFTFDTLDADSTLHARMFAPGTGVPEDPVTGTASGACGAYLREVGAFETRSEGRDDGDDESKSEMIPEEMMADVDVNVDVDGVPDELRFEQGHFVDRPGHVRVRVGDEVRVGGRAVTALDGTLVVPSDDGDDIIEA